MNQDRRDTLQNITIVILSVLTVVLFARMQLYTFYDDSLWSFLTPQQTTATTNETDAFPDAPVLIAVTGSYGRFGSICMTAGDESIAAFRSLMGQALASAGDPVPCEETELLAALSGISVYCDFRTSLPVSALAELLWTYSDHDTLSVRRFIVAKEGDGTVLYFWGDGGVCLRSDTAVTAGELLEVTNQYQSDRIQFAFDRTDAGTISPFSLLLTELPNLPVLSRTVVQPETEELLTTLGFNPKTQNRYEDTNGAVVIREEERTLRIQTDGSIVYQSNGSDQTPAIAANGESPALTEAVSGAAALLRSLLPQGDGELYLTGVSKSGSTITLTFGCQVNGVPVRLADGSNMGEVVLSGSAVSSAALFMTRYTVTETASLLLPVRQMLAIAAEGTEVTLEYVDRGGSEVSAQWLAE